MELDTALAKLGLRRVPLPFTDQDWADSQQSLPAGVPAFLQRQFIAEACAYAHLPRGVASAVADAAAQASADPAAVAWLWHYQRCCHLSDVFTGRGLRRWPALPGFAPGLLQLAVVLAGIPACRERCRKTAIPESVERATLLDIKRRIRSYRARRGALGVSRSSVAWLRLHLSGRLFQIEKLQLEPGCFAVGASVYRHRQSRAVIALAEAFGGPFEGIPIDPSGVPGARAVRLSPAEWDPVLSPGDPVLHIHLPGSPPGFEQAGHALALAAAFFRDRFPDRRFAAFCGSSWMFDRQLASLLPESTDLVRIQRQIHLLPRESAEDLRERIFERPATCLPQDAVRRALASHLSRGGQLHGGRAFFLMDDVPRWGEEPYRAAVARLPLRVLSPPAWI